MSGGNLSIGNSTVESVRTTFISCSALLSHPSSSYSSLHNVQMNSLPNAKSSGASDADGRGGGIYMNVTSSSSDLSISIASLALSNNKAEHSDGGNVIFVAATDSAIVQDATLWTNLVHSSPPTPTEISEYSTLYTDSPSDDVVLDSGSVISSSLLEVEGDSSTDNTGNTSMYIALQTEDGTINPPSTLSSIVNPPKRFPAGAIVGIVLVCTVLIAALVIIALCYNAHSDSTDDEQIIDDIEMSVCKDDHADDNMVPYTTDASKQTTNAQHDTNADDTETSKDNDEAEQDTQDL